MRYLPIIIIFLFSFSAEAITGPDTRFDWSLGKPAITADAPTNCTDTAQARFDWFLGQPAIVHDATANCTLATGGVSKTSTSTIFKSDIILKSDTILK